MNNEVRIYNGYPKPGMSPVKVISKEELAHLHDEDAEVVPKERPSILITCDYCKDKVLVQVSATRVCKKHTCRKIAYKRKKAKLDLLRNGFQGKRHRTESLDQEVKSE